MSAEIPRAGGAPCPAGRPEPGGRVVPPHAQTLPCFEPPRLAGLPAAEGTAPGRDTPAAAQPPVGRFAPSPSGRMHLGNVLCALLAWLSVRSRGGRMILRIEDLDRARCKPEYAQLLMEDLVWLGLDWDEGPAPPGGNFQPDRPHGPYVQSQCSAIYTRALEQLTRCAAVYPCYCTRAQLHAASAPHLTDGTPLYAGTCRNLTARQREALEAAGRSPAMRMAVPPAGHTAGHITFSDALRGPQEQDLGSACGDFVLRRSDGVFAYQLAVVVDDGRMGVTEVVRGRDLLPSTARQIYLQRLLGLAQPVYRHVPLLVAPDGRRLSKRDGSLDMGALRARFTAPQLVGFLAAACGLAAPGAELSPAQLAPVFHWETVSLCDIVIKEKGWSIWPEKKTRS